MNAHFIDEEHILVIKHDFKVQRVAVFKDLDRDLNLVQMRDFLVQKKQGLFLHWLRPHAEFPHRPRHDVRNLIRHDTGHRLDQTCGQMVVIVRLDAEQKLPHSKGQELGSVLGLDVVFVDAQKQSDDFGAVLEKVANVGMRMGVNPVQKRLAENDNLSLAHFLMT